MNYMTYETFVRRRNKKLTLDELARDYSLDISRFFLQLRNAGLMEMHSEEVFTLKISHSFIDKSKIVKEKNLLINVEGQIMIFKQLFKNKVYPKGA